MNWFLTLALAALGKVLPVQSGIDMYLTKETVPMPFMGTLTKDDVLIAVDLDSAVTDVLEQVFRKYGIELHSAEARAHMDHVFGEDFSEMFADPEGED